MIIFSNPGLIDIEAVTTLGVSVKRPGSFGRFGTGLKFAVATILRGGGHVTLWRGLERHEFSTIARDIRGQSFDLVTLDDQTIGITTMLGRDWQPWMVLRELGCNALDEGGRFSECGEFGNNGEDSTTTIVVNWPDLEIAYQQRDALFLPTDTAPLHQNDKLRVLPGVSANLFYRGIRVYKLAKPSLLTYDIIEEQYLTEDRTLASSYSAESLAVDMLLQVESRELASQVLTAEKTYYEAHLDYGSASWGVKPSRAWLDAAIEARENRTLNNESARKILLKYMRDSSEVNSFQGLSYRRVVNDKFNYGLDVLRDLGIKFDADQKFIEVPELPGENMLSMLEQGRIYYVPALMEQSARRIAEELMVRWAEIRVEGYDQESMARLLIPLILGRSSNLKADEQMVAEDEASLNAPDGSEVEVSL